MGFRVKLSDEDVADFEVVKDVAIVTVFGFLYMGCTLTPRGEYDRTVHVQGDAALYQIILTTCYNYYYYHFFFTLGRYIPEGV